jgi:hypothetical protein
LTGRPRRYVPAHDLRLPVIRVMLQIVPQHKRCLAHLAAP